MSLPLFITVAVITPAFLNKPFLNIRTCLNMPSFILTPPMSFVEGKLLVGHLCPIINNSVQSTYEVIMSCDKPTCRHYAPLFSSPKVCQLPQNTWTLSVWYLSVVQEHYAYMLMTKEIPITKENRLL